MHVRFFCTGSSLRSSFTAQHPTYQLVTHMQGIGSDAPGDLSIESESIMTVIEAAMRLEWGVRLRPHRDKLVALSLKSGTDIDLYTELEKGGVWSIVKPDKTINNIFSNLPNVDQFDTALDRDLFNDAIEIIERKNIFALVGAPRKEQALAEISSFFERNIDFIFSEISGSLDHGYCFVRDNSSHAEEIFKNIISSFLIKTSAYSFKLDSLLLNKEGPILIEGSTGSGKSMAAELIARIIGRRILKQNISAMSENLLESAFRGYRSGQFTGANPKGATGLFQKAHGKVLFLDEFQNASIASQTQLLDLLSSVSNIVKVSKMGEEDTVESYNVKVILAVNKPIAELLSGGVLRHDLFHRVRDVIKFKTLSEILDNDPNHGLLKSLMAIYRWNSLPIIDARKDLAEYVGVFFPELKEEDLSPLVSYNWPGNFRQIERVICDIYWRTDYANNQLSISDLISRTLSDEDSRISSTPTLTLSPLAQKIKAVENILHKNNFNLSKALPQLKHYSLGSRPTLRNFLRIHSSELSSSITNDSKMQSFMKDHWRLPQ